MNNRSSILDQLLILIVQKKSYFYLQLINNYKKSRKDYNSLKIDDITLVKFLAKGAYGDIYLVRKKP